MAEQEVPDYYDLLMISRDASPKEVNDAYKHAMWFWAPERNRSLNRTESYRKLIEKTARQLGDAKEILMDPRRRPAYDQLLAEAEAQRTVSLTDALRDALSPEQKSKQPRRYKAVTSWCAVCEREMTRKKDGTIRLHFDEDDERCDGSNKPTARCWSCERYVPLDNDHDLVDHEKDGQRCPGTFTNAVQCRYCGLFATVDGDFKLDRHDDQSDCNGAFGRLDYVVSCPECEKKVLAHYEDKGKARVRWHRADGDQCSGFNAVVAPRSVR